MAWRVLVVDDHSAFRRVATRLLRAEGLDVVGEAATGQAALRQAEALRPDIVLLDILLPDLDGFAVAERLATLPSTPAVVLTSSRAAVDFGPRLPARHAPWVPRQGPAQRAPAGRTGRARVTSTVDSQASRPRCARRG